MKIEVLENYQAKSTIVNPKISNVDVFSIMSDESYAYVNFLQLSYGAIIRSHTMELKKKLQEIISVDDERKSIQQDLDAILSKSNALAILRASGLISRMLLYFTSP